jgi:uncharacterized protein YndB with AHSA1/START domain
MANVQVVDVKPESDRELVLCRIIDVPREKLYRAWTEPSIMKQWFAPKPWTTPIIENDLRPGGASRVVMRGPDGTEQDASGVYLEVVRNEKIVFTDAYKPGWVPSESPFMTAIVTFEDIGGGKTKYTARARHFSLEALKEHEKMGFHEGWGVVAQQLADVAARL